MIVAPTYPMLRDVTQKTFFELLRSTNYQFRFNKSDGHLEIFGRNVYFRSADNPERLRGPNLSWFYGDEFALVRAETWDILIGRIRVGKPRGWITTTPKGYNWIYRRWVKDPLPGYEIIRARTEENKHLPAEYIEDLKASYVGEFARQELDGEFTLFEGLVYAEYRSALHSPDFQTTEGMTFVRAIDYGYTNPFVCLFGAVDEDGRLYIYDEHYASKKLIKDHVQEIKKREGKFSWTVADHDAQDNAEMRSQGIPTINARKNVIEGIQRVKARLMVQGDGRPRLFIHPRCENTIRELQSYQWQESKEGRNDKEEPVKENDHTMDALRYMVMHLDKGQPKLFDLNRMGL